LIVILTVLSALLLGAITWSFLRYGASHFLVVFLVLGCEAGSALCADDRQEPPPLAACAAGPTIVEPDNLSSGAEYRIEGVVEGIGAGGTDECFGAWWGRLGDHIEPGAPELDEAQWISLRTASDELHRVEVIAPGSFQWPTAVGENLVVDLWQHRTGWPPADFHLEVRTRAGDFVYWMGISWRLEDLSIPAEIELADGGGGCGVIGTVCEEEWQERSLRVGVDGETETVAYGAHAPVGPLTFVNHAFEVQTVPPTCADLFVGTAEVAAWRR
jgi:hypothetical protein